MPRTPQLAAALVAFTAFSALAAAGAAHAQTVRAAAGDLAAATAARDLFRADLGGGTETSGGGLFGGVRREINWDGAPDARSAPNLMPADQFAARGVVFFTAGTGFSLSAKAGNPSGTPVLYGNFDAAHATRFAAFSPERLFVSLGDPAFDVVFFVPGTNRPALTTGFGAVFTDVDDAAASTLEFFDLEGASLGVFEVPASAGNATFSFLGVSFPGPAQVARVRVTAGTVAVDLGGEPEGQDAVATDDFLYGEPVEAADAPCIATPTALCLQGERFRVEAAFDSIQAGGGRARGSALSADSGTLSFFAESNREVLIKVLDGCGVNQRYWVYGAAATDVAFDITVTDTATGDSKVYSKEQGPPAPAITDVDAFATCN
jgi:hypothetical protein